MVSFQVNDQNEQLTAGLRAEDAARLLEAFNFVDSYYLNKVVPTGQDVLAFTRSVVSCLASLNADIDTRIAGVLFELPHPDDKHTALIESHFGKEIADLVTGIRQLMRLHEAASVQQENNKT